MLSLLIRIVGDLHYRAPAVELRRGRRPRLGRGIEEVLRHGGEVRVARLRIVAGSVEDGREAVGAVAVFAEFRGRSGERRSRRC